MGEKNGKQKVLSKFAYLMEGLKVGAGVTHMAIWKMSFLSRWKENVPEMADVLGKLLPRDSRDSGVWDRASSRTQG